MPVSRAAINLAVFRIVTGVILATSQDLRAALAVAGLPAALRTPPERLGWWMTALPVSPLGVHIAVAVCVGAALLAAIGLWTRPALAVAMATALYALGVSQLGGAVWHCHHLVWFSALLAVSPCGDALSVDCWRAARRHPRGQMTAWPFACYPTFQWPAAPTMPALLLAAQGAQGEPIELPRPWQLGAAAGPRAFGLAWSLIGVGLDRQPPTPARLRAYWEYLRTQDQVAPLAPRVCTVHFYRATVAVAPEAWSAPPRTRLLLYTLTRPCTTRSTAERHPG